MITIKQHKNFSNWFQVFSFGKMLDEFAKQADAVQFASSIAKNTKQVNINILGRVKEVK